MKTYFDHENLDVYREAIAFCGWVGKFLVGISAKAAAKDQLDRAHFLREDEIGYATEIEDDYEHEQEHE